MHGTTKRTRPIRIFRIVAAGLAVAALAAPAAPAALEDRAVVPGDSAGAPTVVPYLSQGQGTSPERTPPSATGGYSPIPDGYNPPVELPPAASTASGGWSVDWADVGIGAGAVAALAALLGGALVIAVRGGGARTAH